MSNPHERDWRESSLRMRTVAALYIDPLGVYPRLSPCGRYDRKAPGHVCAISSAVDCWDKARNAKLYTGPHPVVAHPDCGPWSKLRHLCTLQDDACGPRAFEQVREFGGVLEHPEHSRLFDHMGAVKPGDATDSYNGRTYLVRQVDWGHCCVKPTWLYVVGVDQLRVMRGIRKRRGTGKATRSINGKRGAATQAKHPTWKEQLPRANDSERRRTPIAFAEWLVSLARASKISNFLTIERVPQ